MKSKKTPITLGLILFFTLSIGGLTFSQSRLGPCSFHFFGSLQSTSELAPLQNHLVSAKFANQTISDMKFQPSSSFIWDHQINFADSPFLPEDTLPTRLPAKNLLYSETDAHFLFKHYVLELSTVDFSYNISLGHTGGSDFSNHSSGGGGGYFTLPSNATHYNLSVSILSPFSADTFPTGYDHLNLTEKNLIFPLNVSLQLKFFYYLGLYPNSSMSPDNLMESWRLKIFDITITTSNASRWLNGDIFGYIPDYNHYFFTVPFRIQFLAIRSSTKEEMAILSSQ